MVSVPILILYAPGTNRDREAALACARAGGTPRVASLRAVIGGDVRLGDFGMLVLPGGFSYADDLGAGRLWASALRTSLGDELADFVRRGRPVLGICNGFQALVKAGVLPGPLGGDTHAVFSRQTATLAPNASGAFECRWVTLAADARSPCVFTRDLPEPLLSCPVAHGEGRVVLADDRVREQVRHARLAPLRYVTPAGAPATWPHNPNGSEDDIAGLCNLAGNVLGLMPHPEDHIDALQHPGRHGGRPGALALPLFVQGVRHAARLRG